MSGNYDITSRVRLQELTYRECIKRIRELASKASADIRDIEDNHEESTDVSKKIKDSKASL